jgi:peptidoglycan/LPS O-acetylase OafA/YrhL
MRATAPGFWRARVARIVPVYWIGMLLFTPLGIAQLWRGDAAVFGATFASSVLLIQAWVPAIAAVWNPPGWSLSVEAFFYGVFPGLGPLLWRISRPRLALGACWMMLVASATLISWLDPHRPSWPWTENPDSCDWNIVLNFNPLLRLPEFAAGILACRIWSTDSRLVNRTSFEWLIPLLVAALVAWRTPLNPDLATLGLLCPAIAVWLVVLAVARRHVFALRCASGWAIGVTRSIFCTAGLGLMLAANQENGELANHGKCRSSLSRLWRQPVGGGGISSLRFLTVGRFTSLAPDSRVEAHGSPQLITIAFCLRRGWHGPGARCRN